MFAEILIFNPKFDEIAVPLQYIYNFIMMVLEKTGVILKKFLGKYMGNTKKEVDKGNRMRRGGGNGDGAKEKHSQKRVLYYHLTASQQLAKIFLSSVSDKSLDIAALLNGYLYQLIVNSSSVPGL